MAPVGIRVATLEAFEEAIEVVEDGETFAENAAKKAVEQARILRQWVLAEDSGLVVDALGGRPGVYSARYAGPAATDAANNAKLLEELGDTPVDQRTAHYVCHVALADPDGNVRATRAARCHGRITRQPHGIAGFGYDPLFEIPEYHRTFGQLGATVKSLLSHRGRALRAAVPDLMRLLSGS